MLLLRPRHSLGDKPLPPQLSSGGEFRDYQHRVRRRSERQRLLMPPAPTHPRPSGVLLVLLLLCRSPGLVGVLVQHA